jgi:hypothetical protein
VTRTGTTVDGEAVLFPCNVTVVCAGTVCAAKLLTTGGSIVVVISAFAFGAYAIPDKSPTSIANARIPDTEDFIHFFIIIPLPFLNFLVYFYIKKAVKPKHSILRP